MVPERRVFTTTTCPEYLSRSATNIWRDASRHEGEVVQWRRRVCPTAMKVIAEIKPRAAGRCWNQALADRLGAGVEPVFVVGAMTAV